MGLLRGRGGAAVFEGKGAGKRVICVGGRSYKWEERIERAPEVNVLGATAGGGGRAQRTGVYF